MKKIFSFVILLLCINMHAQNKINRYEYWFDNNYAARTTTNITPVVNYTLNTGVPTTTLTTGLHVIHLRFRDDSSRWSSTVSQFFFKVPQPTTTTVNMVGYEYWYDNNYAGRVYTATAVQQNVNVTAALSAASLSDGLHVIHIRFKDSAGQWSSAVSQFFYKTQNAITTTRQIVSYQYWYDNNFSGAVTSAVGPSQNYTLTSALPASSLSDGLHVLHMRFLDNTGMWSSTVSQFFHKSGASSTTTVNITDYQYWFDNDFNSAITASVTPQQNITVISSLAASSLSDGLHVFHLRFRDNTGKWSSVVSSFFHKTGTSTVANNMVTAYRYWFDQADSNMVYSAVSPVTNLTLNTSISMITVPKGVHTVHFQFKDTLGMWSSVVTDTVTKLAVPIAMFTANDTIFCDSGTVAFMDHSIDGDTYYWYFGDGDTSNTVNPTHLYAQPGLYSVSLTVQDTLTGRDSMTTYVQYIQVYATPSAALSVSPDDTICAGQTVTMTAANNASYSWNTGATTQSITTGTTGDFWTTVSNTSYAGCFLVSDTVHIEVMPLPVVNLGSDTSFCEGNSFVLDAQNAGATFLWNTGATTSSINTNAGGSFWVSVTSVYGCQNADTVVLTIDSLPAAGFTSNIIGTTASFNDQSTNNTTWSWDFGDGNFSTLQNPTHNYGAPGTYTVTLIVSNSCDSDTATDIIIISGVDEVTANSGSLIAFPNPATDHVTINCIPEWSGVTILSVYDVSGRAVAPALQTTFTSKALNTVVLNTSELSNGVYTIRITSGSAELSTRIVIAR